MLSRNCDGCSQIRGCRKRYKKVRVNEKVYCPDGTAHLVDNSSKRQTYEFEVAETIQVC